MWRPTDGQRPSPRYHPNTMLKSVAHGNGVDVTHGLGPHVMRRPASIAKTNPKHAEKVQRGMEWLRDVRYVAK